MYVLYMLYILLTYRTYRVPTVCLPLYFSMYIHVGMLINGTPGPGPWGGLPRGLGRRTPAL